ncbi:MAG: redoxin domain-containing protein [Bdellovibrionales bacterium]|nr:redoxin domain-containing protein [Bdellovibrionales bacterium]
MSHSKINVLLLATCFCLYGGTALANNENSQEIKSDIPKENVAPKSSEKMTEKKASTGLTPSLKKKLAPEQYGVSVGKVVPDFTLDGSDGKEHSLSSHKGKYIVLEWFNNGCPFVDKHYKTGNMQRLQEKFSKEGAVWYTIASSQEGSQGYIANDTEAKKIMDDRGIKHSTILLDAAGDAYNKFEAKTTPHMFLISPEGKLLYHGAIDDKRSFSANSVKEASNYLEKAYEEVKAGKAVSTPYARQYGCSIKQDRNKKPLASLIQSTSSPLL